MTYEEKLNAIRTDIKTMTAECVANNDDECAQALIGLCLMVSDVRNKLAEYGLGEQAFTVTQEVVGK